MKTYSQFGQDAWVLEYFDKGIFLDIGMADGIFISNTKMLDDLGWSGLGIDPYPRNYETRKNTNVVTGCVSGAEADVEFIEAGDLGGISQYIHVHKNDLPVVNANRTMIKSYPLEYFLIKHNMPQMIEYFSLDTEGSEYQILSNIDFHKWTFGCITVEHNMVKETRHKINNLLVSNGYIFDKELGVDDCYIHHTIRKQ